MAKLKQFLLLLTKNFTLQFRHPWVTLFELGVPLFFSFLLVAIRVNVSSEYVSEPTVYSPFSLSFRDDRTVSFGPRWNIMYTPNSSICQNIMEEAVQHLGRPRLKGFSTEKELVNHYLNSSESDFVKYAGVVFENSSGNITSAEHITYKVRLKALQFTNRTMEFVEDWRTKFMFPFVQTMGPREKDDLYGGSPGYLNRGFLHLQHAVALGIISVLSSQNLDVSNVDLYMQRYPYPPYDDDKFVSYLQFYLPIAFMFSFIYPCLNIVKNVVVEKERGLKEAMKMMGLSNWMHSTAWALKYFIFLSVSCAMMTLLLTVEFSANRAVINYADPTVLFFILLVYATCIIAFSFLLSVLFSKANSATAGAGIVFFLSVIPYFFVYPRYSDLSLSSKMASCTLLNTALAMAAIVLLKWEGTGVGLKWDTLHTPATPDDELSMNLVLLMMFVDAVMYALLAWYIEAVFPGEYGIPEPWYFPFTRSYWCGPQRDIEDLGESDEGSYKTWLYFEAEPSDLQPGIQLYGLTKVYKKSKPPAVNNLCVSMYRGQITVLLGHNGAGKTTTISMLTGLFPPTSGTGVVNGHDICDDIDGVHSSLGICPQHNILFDDLTVEEHLYFFCRLKGYISELVPHEVDQMVHAIGLEEKSKALAKTLSGGMKRKLCVGISLVGGSQVVMLDEPTSGMDPSSRRFIWDLLQAEKEDRTILLTTHSMEEADILGDRIAIMAAGEIQCCGTPLFLKKAYGGGYYLVIVKKPGCDVSAITDLVCSYVPGIEVYKNIGAELSYFLPLQSSHAFQELFKEIESKQESLLIATFGASMTTMEEVFMRVGQRALGKCGWNAGSLQKNSDQSSSSSDSGAQDLEASQKSTPVEDDIEKNQGTKLFCQQLKALLLKRALYSSRSWSLTLSQILLPPFFLVLALSVLKTLPTNYDAVALPLELSYFSGTTTPYSTTNNNTEEMKMIEYFLSQLNAIDKAVLVRNMTAFLIREGKEAIGRYNLHDIIGLTVRYDENRNSSSLLSWFNNQAFHSPAISLLFADNVLLKYFVNSSYLLSVINHPLPTTAVEKAKQLQIHPTEAYQISQNIVFGMAFLISSFAVFLVKERSLKSKHLQLVSGVNLFSFWMANFLWDFLCYLVSCAMLLLVFVCFDTDGMSSKDEQGRLFLLLVLHGLSAIHSVYVLSFLFHIPATAYVTLCLVSIVGGIGTVLTVNVLEIPQINSEDVANALDWFFTILLPNYCLGRSFGNLYLNTQFNKICNQDFIQASCNIPQFFLKACCPGKCGDQCIPWEANYFAWTKPGIGKQLLFLSVQFLMLLIILACSEMKFFRQLKYCLRRHKIVPVIEDEALSIIEDEAVYTERQRILNSSTDELRVTNRLILKQLTKRYGSLLAVDKLSFGVGKGECFGLLGLNGAGKTTTFQMITGERSITSGEVYIDGLSVRQSLRKVQQKVGYCPQFDALIGELTGRETLTMYARLRGLPECIIPQQISDLSTLMSLRDHIDKLVKEYSGGNKRKLSVAVSLVGNPSMIFLDEPTTGMDPVARHRIWDTLLHVLTSGRSIILTSHSMEECEALCNRLVIMVNGRLCCLGSPQQLKSKFGQGFTLILKVRRPPPERCVHSRDEDSLLPPASQTRCTHISSDDEVGFRNDVHNVKMFVRETFPGSELRDVHEGYLHYHVPKSDLSWSQMFGAVEAVKEELKISDYSIGQTTLEQVFLNFAQAQKEQN